jgi:hypothetical protein
VKILFLSVGWCPDRLNVSKSWNSDFFENISQGTESKQDNSWDESCFLPPIDSNRSGISGISLEFSSHSHKMTWIYCRQHLCSWIRLRWQDRSLSTSTRILKPERRSLQIQIYTNQRFKTETCLSIPDFWMLCCRVRELRVQAWGQQYRNKICDWSISKYQLWNRYPLILKYKFSSFLIY